MRAYSEFTSLYEHPETAPISFTYNGIPYKGLGDFPLKERNVTETTVGIEFTLVHAIDEGLICKLCGKYCTEFGQYEYTVYFENIGDSPSGVISDFWCLDRDFIGEGGVLRGNLGDHQNKYRAYSTELESESVNFRQTSGRSTHVLFPYFDLVHGDGGSLIALGWAGTWESNFTAAGECVKVKAKSCIDLTATLLPSESIRSALVVILPYNTRDSFNATNLWREWFMKYNLPRASRRGDCIQPLTTMCWAGDTGLPNSDGSISERSTTWRRTFEKMTSEGIFPDFRWFDAGWYCAPDRSTVPSDWWGTVGAWELDPAKWPEKSFKESVDACHSVGIKTLVWFEPERVTDVDSLVKNYGYRAEWANNNAPWLERPPMTNNIGNSECLNWTFGRIAKMLEENDVDLYREDNNTDPSLAWPMLDAAEERKYSVPRRGISENKLICGHYKLWDMIIEFLGSRGKCTYIDSCASGGGRNDIESLRRSVPFLRSDSDRTTASLRLSMTSSFCKWIPVCGSSTKESSSELEGGICDVESAYVNRASFLPIMNYSVPLSQKQGVDYAAFHENVNEWRSVSHMLTKDFYALMPWHAADDLTSWTVFAYDDPDIGESVILAFRMEDCEEESCTVSLPFAEYGAEYILENADTGERETVLGAELVAGYTITIDEPKKSVLIKLRAVSD